MELDKENLKKEFKKIHKEVEKLEVVRAVDRSEPLRVRLKNLKKRKLELKDKLN